MDKKELDRLMERYVDQEGSAVLYQLNENQGVIADWEKLSNYLKSHDINPDEITISQIVNSVSRIRRKKSH